MRATSASSLRPMVSVCMLARLRRRTPTTRSTDPGRSLTNRTRICSRASSCGALDWPARRGGWTGTARSGMMVVLLYRFFNHTGDRRAGSDHRVDVRLWLNDEIDNHGAFGLHRRAHRRRYILEPRDAHAVETVCLGQFGIVRAGDGSF